MRSGCSLPHDDRGVVTRANRKGWRLACSVKPGGTSHVGRQAGPKKKPRPVHSRLDGRQLDPQGVCDLGVREPLHVVQEKEDAGAIFDPTSLYDTINQLAGPDGVKTTEGFIGGMFTKAYSRSEVDWVVKQNLKMPRQYAAALLYNHSTQDWRPVIPRITVPTLVVGGRVSVVPWKSQAWIQRQIRGSKIEIFEENEGGNHFMFMENPEKFNRIVRDFMG